MQALCEFFRLRLSENLGKFGETFPMSELQKKIFERMSKEEQMKVMEGYGTLMVDLESEEIICVYRDCRLNRKSA